MLHEFLRQNHSEILIRTEKKARDLAGNLKSSELLKQGLPTFLNNLIAFLKEPAESIKEKNIVSGATVHGKELFRLNYTLSHVVHSYGAICQAITELAVRSHADISTQNFNDLNRCLDIAIASAVSEFQFQSVHNSEVRELQHMGFLVHELRNALSSATVAQEMIKQGLVGTGGSTAIVLEESLARMRDLIDRSLTELRMRADPEIHIEEFNLNVLIDQILLTSLKVAQLKNLIKTKK
jgi:signal transduction histidine kinase